MDSTGVGWIFAVFGLVVGAGLSGLDWVAWLVILDGALGYCLELLDGSFFYLRSDMDILTFLAV